MAGVNPMNMGGEGGNVQAHRTNILAPFLSEGFGHKKDSAWYIRTARLLAIWEDQNKNMSYNIETVFNTTISTVYTHLINDKKWSEKQASDYVLKFKRDYHRLYYGPGMAYIVQQRKRGPWDLLHSTVGWNELKPTAEPYEDIEDDNRPMRVKTSKSFKMQILRCQYFGTEMCEMCASGFFQEYAPSEEVLRKCMNCRKHIKSAIIIPTSSAMEAPRGVRVEMQQQLLLNTRKQFEYMRGVWEKHLTDHLSVPGHLKAPEWDYLYGGKYISSVDTDPNQDWEKKLPVDNPNMEWLTDPEFNGDYPKYLKSKGKSVKAKVDLPAGTPTFPIEDGEQEVVVAPVEEQPADETQGAQ